MTPMTLAKFDTLADYDFNRGSIHSEIAAALREREAFLTLLTAALDQHTELLVQPSDGEWEADLGELYAVGKTPLEAVMGLAGLMEGKR